MISALLLAAAAAASPIEVDLCRLDSTGGSLWATSGPIVIKFVNTYGSSADVVRFRVNFAGRTVRIRDVGNFAPEVTIQHRFRDTNGIDYSPMVTPQETCAVEYAHFVDGSTWNENSGSH